jgi:hypothetical protein
MLKDLTGRGFGCTPEQVRRAEFLFARMKSINYFWDNDAMRAGKDWFSNFLKRNGEKKKKKRGRLSRARAQGLNARKFMIFLFIQKSAYGTPCS